jgi:hypothetical protein
VLVVDALEEYALPYFRDVQEADAWFRERRPDRFRIAVRVAQEETDKVLRFAWALRPVLVVTEEADLEAPPGAMNEGMRYLVNYGRRFDIGAWFTTRRPFMLDRSVTANARYLVLFPTPEPRDRQYFESFVPAELKGKIWNWLDRARGPGYCAVVDTRERTLALVAPDGVPEPVDVPEPEPEGPPEPPPEPVEEEPGAGVSP